MGVDPDGVTGTVHETIVREFVSLPSTNIGRAGAGGHPCQGLYHRPADRAPSVACIATHYSIDFSEHYLAEHLAARGIGFLGWNTRFRGDDAHFLLEPALVDIGVGVRWLREVAGVDTVVLIGNSGGGSLMAAYQSQAVEPNIEPLAGTRLPPGFDDLEPGDLYVSVAAHAGRPDVLTDWLDAAVVDETDPTVRDPDLDLWNPRNGPPYDDAFVTRYRAAQVARNERITDWALAELDRLAEHGLRDRTFTVTGTWADPRSVDPTLEPSDREANRCYLGEPALVNRSVWGLASSCTLRTWLSMWSLRTSRCRADDHLARITVPALVVNATADAGVFPSDAARITAALGSRDLTTVDLVADHYFLVPDDARDELADRIATWIRERA